eukprot:scaffold2679_cov251-Pinguiococcus_pyrenoidosus.AAC.1
MEFGQKLCSKQEPSSASCVEQRSCFEQRSDHSIMFPLFLSFFGDRTWGGDLRFSRQSLSFWRPYDEPAGRRPRAESCGDLAAEGRGRERNGRCAVAAHRE